MKSRIFIFLFTGILLAGFVINILFPVKATVSEVENRNLAVVAKLDKATFFSGEFFKSIENYYADHFWNRDTIIGLSSNITALKGIKGEDNVSIITVDQDFNTTTNDADNQLAMNDNKEVLAKTSKEGHNKRIENYTDLDENIKALIGEKLQFYMSLNDEKPEMDKNQIMDSLKIEDNPELKGGMAGNFLLVNDSAYEIFGYSENSCEYYANAINEFANKLPKDDKVYSLLAPSKIEFIASEKYRNMAESQSEAIAYINGKFNEKVKPVLAYNEISNHTDEYLYFKSDHHWTATGAYYAYRAFAAAIGDKPYEKEEFKTVDVPDFLGTLYSKTGKPKAMRENPDYVRIYKPFVENSYTIYTKEGAALDYLDVIEMSWQNKSNKYMVFLSGDNPLAVIDTELDNGRSIMVFKDSYGNAFVPFLMNHYDKIYIIDPRHYNDGAITYAKEHDIHEFLFLNYDIVIAGSKGFSKNILKVSY